MDHGALTWSDTETIIDSELRRFRGTLPGYDTDDLKQECRLAAARACQLADSSRGTTRAYVRKTVRTALVKLLRRTTTLARCPHDPWGRPLRALSPIDDLMPMSTGESPETTVSNREAVTYLSERLDARDWDQLVSVFVEGAQIAREDRVELRLNRAKAAAILARIWYRVEREVEEEEMSAAKDAVIPPCHANGDNPQGYDTKDKTCLLCPDKLTCLPAAIERKLVPLKLKADREVEAYVAGKLSYDDAIDRMKERLAFQKAGKPVPENLLPTWAGLIEDNGAIDAEFEEVEEEEEPEEEDTEPEEEEDDEEPEESDEEEADDSEDDEEEEQEQEEVADEDEDAQDTDPAPEEASAATEDETVQTQTHNSKRRKKTAKTNGKSNGVSAMKANVKVARNGAVTVAGVKVGVVEKHPEGWGWWSEDGKTESPDWLGSKDEAVAGLASAKCTEAIIKKAATKPASKKKPARKAATKTKPKAKAKKKAATKKPATRTKDRPNGWPELSNGKPMPEPAVLDQATMDGVLATTQKKLGCNIELDYGMKIARRKRGSDCVVEITPQGFKYQVDADLAKAAKLKVRTQTFGSLSSVAMWHERRMVSGNDFFNIAKHSCTEVRDKQGRIIDRKGGIG